jgi:hypothetical protein
MATGIDFPEANFTYGPPAGMTEDQVKSLRVFTGPTHSEDRLDREVISKWQLTPEELAEIARTGVVWLYIIGDGHPPVYVTGTSPFASVTKTEEKAAQTWWEWLSGCDTKYV